VAVCHAAGDFEIVDRCENEEEESLIVKGVAVKKLAYDGT